MFRTYARPFGAPKTLRAARDSPEDPLVCEPPTVLAGRHQPLAVPPMTDEGSIQAAPPATAPTSSEPRSSRHALVLREYGPGIARVAGGYTRTAAEREDLTQEVALAIWSALPRFRGEASLRTFVFRIAHNCAITHLRRRRSSIPQGELIDGRPSPHMMLEKRNQHEQLMAAIAALPLGLREVLQLKLEGLAYTQIAQAVGISEKNVSVRLSRARQALRKTLERTR